MSAVVDRVACPECGAQFGERCWDTSMPLSGRRRRPHTARWEALWALNRRLETTNVNDRSTP